MSKEAKLIHDFGIEIEVKHVKRRDVAEMIADYFNTVYHREHDYYDTYLIRNREGRRVRVWKCMSDGSLNDGNKGCEIVSPILQYCDKDLNDLKNILERLKLQFPVVDHECSIHIHIDATRLTLETLVKLQKLWFTYEDLIYRALQVKESREERYCKKTDSYFIFQLLEKKSIDYDTFKDFWYGQSNEDEEDDAKYNSSRYHSLNYHCYFRQGTVEFRLFNGTIDFDTINSYIQFCQAVVSQAMEMHRSKGKKVKSYNEKFTMRNWLRKLGLNGDKFKICRKVLMENLSGNSAQRFN